MRWIPLVLVACGSPSAPVTPDAPPPVDAFDPGPDPFAGMYDDPSEFPRDTCVAGSLAGFARSELYFEAGLRTEAGPPLRTFLADFIYGESEVPNLHTDDDLLIRRSKLEGGAQWVTEAIDICAAGADGTVRGTRVRCQVLSDGPHCSERPFVALPYRRAEGEAEAEHLTLLGELGSHWPSSSSNVRVVGDIAYLSRFDDGLRIVSIANPAAPVELGHLALAGQEYANDLKIVSAGNRRYAITASYTANVIDVTDPANPQLVAQLPFAPHSVFVEGTLLYLVNSGDAKLEIWDIANPGAPVQRGAWEGELGAWHDVFVTGGIAYLSDIYGSGLHVVDVRDPANPVVLGGEDDLFSAAWHTPWLTRVGGRAVAINGTEFSDIGMRLLDGDPASPTFLATLGEWTLGRGSAHNLMAIGSRVYFAYYRDGVRVVDIANLAAPVQIAHFNTWPADNAGATAGDLGAFGIDLDPVRKRIYVADSIRGLVILQGDATVFP